jgi:hypothetical protein
MEQSDQLWVQRGLPILVLSALSALLATTRLSTLSGVLLLLAAALALSAAALLTAALSGLLVLLAALSALAALLAGFVVWICHTLTPVCVSPPG